MNTEEVVQEQHHDSNEQFTTIIEKLNKIIYLLTPKSTVMDEDGTITHDVPKSQL